MFKTYEETINFLYENLPMFQRVGVSALKLDLKNTFELCAVLGNPHLKFKSIHIAGTNGKGSTSHMLAAILQSSGYKTGLYTSPHLKSFTERIKIDGGEISKEHVVDFVNRIYPSIEKLKPSFFEITVAMAFDYFAFCEVDIAVVEVGLGGRLDSTNVIVPEVSVITNIGWDHMDILGDTLEKIAEEKAGIIKQGIPVVISERQEGINQVYHRRAQEMHASVYFAEDRFKAVAHAENDIHGLDISENGRPLFQNLILPLQGIYQQKNILGVLQTVYLLEERGWRIPTRAVQSGLENVVEQTGLKGRWQILNRRPLIVCDTGHNLDGVKQVLRQINEQSYQNLFFVFGMVKGKEPSAILELLPRQAYYFFCQPKIPRAVDAASLFDRAQDYHLMGEVIPDVNDALLQAKKKASENDMIFIGGSTYVVAELEDL